MIISIVIIMIRIMIAASSSSQASKPMVDLSLRLILGLNFLKD